MLSYVLYVLMPAAGCQDHSRPYFSRGALECTRNEAWLVVLQVKLDSIELVFIFPGAFFQAGERNFYVWLIGMDVEINSRKEEVRAARDSISGLRAELGDARNTEQANKTALDKVLVFPL